MLMGTQQRTAAVAARAAVTFAGYTQTSRSLARHAFAYTDCWMAADSAGLRLQLSGCLSVAQSAEACCFCEHERLC